MRLVSAVALTAVLATTAHGFCPSSLLPAQTPRAGVLAGRAPRAARRFAPRAALEVIDSSYNLALGSLALGGLFGVPGSPLKSKVGAFAAGEITGPRVPWDGALSSGFVLTTGRLPRGSARALWAFHRVPNNKS